MPEPVPDLDPASAERPYPDGIAAIFEIARRLRAPDGCPWDREQTHESLRPYLLEETYELLEAIDSGGDSGQLLEELGDVLLQVAMHAAIAEERGLFDGNRVSEAAAAKMVARHPHVFGSEQVADAEDVLRNWERRKLEEAERSGAITQTPLDRVPVSLPALAWTYNMQKRAARVGFDFEHPAGAAAVVAEEARELAEAAASAQADADPATFEEVGDLLLAVVALARNLKVNPEDALRSAGGRFRERFATMDSRLRASGSSYRELSAEQIRELWEAARPGAG
ncbi:MAG: nucleoside triphosphate pyrophosphohydrolase [Candidatus Dormibacteraeota bacterium]|nr:nucleoside triphosphate pyrophosphohydrolase [Candidatus Dormibacteraeota bacterium]